MNKKALNRLLNAYILDFLRKSNVQGILDGEIPLKQIFDFNSNWLNENFDDWEEVIRLKVGVPNSDNSKNDEIGGHDS